MGARRPTIADVARAADVSVAAVSQAINGRGRISAATRQHILTVAGNLGYRPNPTATALRRGESHRVGLISRFGREPAGRPTDNAFYLDIALPLADALLSEGLSLELVPAGHRDRADDPELGVAIIIDPLTADPLIDDLQRQGARIVTIGSADGVAADAVVDRGAAGADVIVDALEAAPQATGARIEALLTETPVASSIAVRRYLEAIAADDPGRIGITALALDANDDDITATVAELCDPARPRCSLYAPYDGHAMAALRALDMLGIDDDAVVVATHYSRHPESRWGRPLLSLDLHLDVMARQCADLAIGLLSASAPASVVAPLPTARWAPRR